MRRETTSCERKADCLRALNIPSGRVFQRIRAYQDVSKAPPSSSRSIPPRPPNSTPVNSTTPVLAELQQETQHTAPLPVLHSGQQNHSPKPDEHIEYEEIAERGRTLQRSSSPLNPEELEEVDEVLEDVRARLFSVQKIVRREQSGSSQARDEMMDELGSMLDNAIATTITPHHTSLVPTRSSSSRRPSPRKQTPVPSTLSRSQTMKATSPRSSVAEPIETHPERVISKSSPKAGKTPVDFDLPTCLLEQESDFRRNRQVSEPAAFVTRRTGFPLSSPVRERALL